MEPGHRAFSTAVLMASLGMETVSGALGLGLFTVSGFLAATTINTGITPNPQADALWGLSVAHIIWRQV